MEGSHTGENIKENLLATQARWKFAAPIAVTDNAANEKKAFDLLQWTRFGCYGHRLNLVVKNALAIPEVSKLVAKGRKLVTFFHSSSSSTDLLLKKQQLLLPESARGHKLIQDVPTRWNSTYLMLERLLEQTPAVMATISDPNINKQAASTLKNCVFSFDEQLVVEKLVTILEPFLKATKSVCADRSPTMHKIVPMLLKLDVLTNISPDDSQMVQKVKAKMNTELKQRDLTEDRELILMACMLNPFTKDLDFLPYEEKSDAHSILLKKAQELCSDPQTTRIKTELETTQSEPVEQQLPLPELPSMDIEPSTSVDIQSDNEMKNIEMVAEPDTVNLGNKEEIHQSSDMDDWLQDVVCIGHSKKTAEEVIHLEVSRYFGAAQNDQQLTILEWWKKHEIFYPRLSVLARKYLAVPASSVSSERIFSLAGQLVNKKRARLSSKNIDTFIFLNKNMSEYW